MTGTLAAALAAAPVGGAPSAQPAAVPSGAGALRAARRVAGFQRLVERALAAP